ncbi:helix-turn-helix domain-containing protein [Lapillicoccus sp.]|uniref:helix-turn-helix domain-containing protein n=1 Tax=Lapillicoccus sp. TaxID=1909287 RepID=UPI0025ED1307|nr:helix-turn-helix domain-containing protein [Lapillicoccus sp.]
MNLPEPDPDPAEIDDLTSAIAATLHTARGQLGLSVSALADRSGVSRAMISRIERGGAQPTAVLLGRLSGALGMSLSELLARAEGEPRRLVRADDQIRWTDPETGYVRRAVSPAPGGPLELVEVVLPAGAVVAYPAESYAFNHHQLWVLAGRLHFREGDVVHELGPGDCLQLGAPQDCAYENRTGRPCRYLVALARR